MLSSYSTLIQLYKRIQFKTNYSAVQNLLCFCSTREPARIGFQQNESSVRVIRPRAHTHQRSSVFEQSPTSTVSAGSRIPSMSDHSSSVQYRQLASQLCTSVQHKTRFSYGRPVRACALGMGRVRARAVSLQLASQLRRQGEKSSSLPRIEWYSKQRLTYCTQEQKELLSKEELKWRPREYAVSCSSLARAMLLWLLTRRTQLNC